MNMQFAVQFVNRESWIVDREDKDNDPRSTIFVLEVNPRASRTVPFVSKATGVSAGPLRFTGDGRQDAGRTGVI